MWASLRGYISLSLPVWDVWWYVPMCFLNSKFTLRLWQSWLGPFCPFFSDLQNVVVPVVGNLKFCPRKNIMSWHVLLLCLDKSNIQDWSDYSLIETSALGVERNTKCTNYVVIHLINKLRLSCAKPAFNCASLLLFKSASTDVSP